MGHIRYNTLTLHRDTQDVEKVAHVLIDERRDVQRVLELHFRARGMDTIPDGDYLVWLASGEDFCTRVEGGKVTVYPADWGKRGYKEIR